MKKANHSLWIVLILLTSAFAVSLWIHEVSLARAFNKPPIADAGGPYSGYESVPITFDASESSDPDGKITTYTWDFDDNVAYLGKTVTHV
ncbi:MAG: PKD domain-containing protein, partial [Candidatus Bathyarchaeota archaeon]